MTALARLEIPSGTDVRGFLIEGQLGAGGFGTVYRARRGERLYALKFIRIKDAGGWAKREVESLLRVSHRSVVGFEGCGFWPEETREYLVVIMDYVEGRQLDVWAKEENPAAREVAQKVLGVGQALETIHRENVIHRDLKEANIIVRASTGEVVVVDFGVAGGPHTARVTRDVVPPCTFEYRSPEAWRFLRENVGRQDVHYQPGPADDLYALGVILYWLLTGRYPCVGVTEAEQAEVTIHQVPEPPRAVNPRVPEAISVICMKLLEKQPEDRYPDAATLCSTVEPALAAADAAWNVPLCDAHAPDNLTTEGKRAREDGDDGVAHWLREARHAHERPRRGKRPTPAAPERKPPLAPGVDAAPALPAPPAPAQPADAAPPAEGVQPSRSVAQPVRSWVVLGLGLVAALEMAVARLHARPEPPLPATDKVMEGSSAGFFAVIPEMTLETTWKVGGKVASPWKPPEAARQNFFAAERATLPWAPSEVREQGETSVNSPQEKQKKVLGAMGKAISTGIACFGMACTGPQVRPEPPAEPCPAGALKAMAELDISIGDDYPAVLVSGQLREIIPLREGWNSVRLIGQFKELSTGTILKGRLMFGSERVYGRFTEAQDRKTARTWPICMELLNHDNARGLPMKPGSTAEAAKVFNSVGVKAVDHFQ
ncbi:serine/threonine-protein kinase [Hyalangium versicolor]|uniref:serine/threonine-protein kinase n=1 Tax=Hyalangium versicolor TaxID=2861190 RepID=UPI001CC972C2|nr:serine/threonine-protein kinase [Hyalangium versicolor]